MILCLKTNGHDVTILTDNLQLGSAVLVAALYTLLQNIRLSAQIQKSITGIAKYSFGIYLTHIYIARFGDYLMVAQFIYFQEHS